MSEKETKKWKKLSQTIQEEDTAERNEAYNDYVKEVTPTHNLVANMVKAFFTGGTICCIGQFLLNTCQGFGLDKDTSGSWCQSDFGACQRDFNRVEYLPFHCQLGRCGGTRSDHRLCQRSCRPGD